MEPSTSASTETPSLGGDVTSKPPIIAARTHTSPPPSVLLLASEVEYRAHFQARLCAGPIVTHDGISVRFRTSDFDHCCYESTHRDRTKDRFSAARAERIDWIDYVLQNPSAAIRQGWDSRAKRHDEDRRVAVVDRMVVVIARTDVQKARFITAYWADSHKTIRKILGGPAWA